MQYITIIIFTTIIHHTVQNQYCALNKQHTLCQYQGVGPKCKTPHERGIPTADRNLIMDMHNTFRSLVATGREMRGRPGPQPQARNMREMEWDDELAAMAQRLADQCKYTHDCLECRKTSQFLTGQNLYQFSENIIRKGADWNTAIRAWYDEVADWSPRHIEKFHFIKPLGHYTQMLWADTFKLGCGYSYFQDGKWNRKLYICNYGPTGNIITLPMYEIGPMCSNCGDGTSCGGNYQGLCSSRGRGGGSRSGSASSGFHIPAAAPPPAQLTTSRPVFQQVKNRFSSPINTLSFNRQQQQGNALVSTTTTTQKNFPTTTQKNFPTTTQRPFINTQRPFVTQQQQQQITNNLKITRYNPHSSPQPISHILLYCNFDTAKCPIRFTGEPWNYTTETTNTGHSFESILPPKTTTNLYIRSIINPTNKICLRFKYLYYIYNEDGTKARAGIAAPTIDITAGTLKQKSEVVKISDKSLDLNDWLNASIEFGGLREKFLLIVQIKNGLSGEFVYVAVDEVYVVDGGC